MSIARVTACNARDCKSKRQWDVGGIAICAEANLATGEQFKGAQGSVVTRTPRTPDAKGSLADVDVTRARASGSVASMDA